MNLDLIDRKLLYHLDQNARQSISQLSKKVRINKNVALYRINKLKENGIIKGSFAEINNFLLGYNTFRLFINLGNASQSKQQQFIDHISKNNNITWFSRVIGRWDIDILFMTKNISKFEDFRKKLFLEFNDIIENFEITILSKIEYYPKNYLLKEPKASTKSTILDVNSNSSYFPDAIDEKILQHLTKDASINIVDLSSRLKISINTLKKRIKNLENEKIILGYRLFIDPTQFGYEYYKFHFSIKHYNKKRLDFLKSWIASQDYIIYIDRYIGGADFEIELMFQKESEYLEFDKKFHEEFGEIVRDSYLLKFYDLKIFKYLPETNN